MIRLSARRVFRSGCMGPGSDITLPSRRKQRPVSRHEFYAMPRAADRSGSYGNASPRSAIALLYGIRSSTICLPPIGEGLHYQVSEVHRCLRAGKLESDIMPLNESLSIMATIDRIQQQGDKHSRQHLVKSDG